jgi:hypothetical protein
LLVSFLTLLAALCPPAAEAVFGITILGALIGGMVGGAFRRLFERTGAFLVGMSLGFGSGLRTYLLRLRPVHPGVLGANLVIFAHAVETPV